jgi:DNA-binding SARP family transcriptional activator
MSRLALYLLGPPRIELDGEPVHIARRKALALLAYLAMTGGSHSRDTLATLLWPEYDQSRARAGLRRTLSELNTTLGEGWLTADRETAGLNPDAGLWLDVDRFRSLLSAWQDHGHPEADICPECLDALSEAVELYQGDFLAGFTLRDSAPFDEWQFFETEGLRDQLASALVRLASYHTSQGEYEPAIGYARRWLALDPLHEPAHRHLMALYAQAGQQSAALRQYQLCEQTLLEELGLPPSEETEALYEQIRTQPADRAEPVNPFPRARHNLYQLCCETPCSTNLPWGPQIARFLRTQLVLPFQPTPFVGREALLAEIADRLEDPACRLLSLVGPGGSGKTRLALEAAAGILSEAQLDNYPHGVYFVSLAPLESAEAIVPTVAQAVGFSFYAEAGGPAQERVQQGGLPSSSCSIIFAPSVRC